MNLNKLTIKSQEAIANAQMIAMNNQQTQIDNLHILKSMLEIDENAVKLIAEEGFDEVYGARPLKRIIRARIENELAKLIISGSLTEGKTIVVEAKDGFLVSKIK